MCVTSYLVDICYQLNLKISLYNRHIRHLNIPITINLIRITTSNNNFINLNVENRITVNRNEDECVRSDYRKRSQVNENESEYQNQYKRSRNDYHRGNYDVNNNQI